MNQFYSAQLARFKADNPDAKFYEPIGKTFEILSFDGSWIAGEISRQLGKGHDYQGFSHKISRVGTEYMEFVVVDSGLDPFIRPSQEQVFALVTGVRDESTWEVSGPKVTPSLVEIVQQNVPS